MWEVFQSQMRDTAKAEDTGGRCSPNQEQSRKEQWRKMQRKLWDERIEQMRQEKGEGWGKEVSLPAFLKTPPPKDPQEGRGGEGPQA